MSASMNPWTIPMLVVAGGYAWYIYEHQDLAKLTPDDKDPNHRPYISAYKKADDRLWQRKEKVRAKALHACQPEYPGTAIGWFVQLPDNTLLKAYGSREKVSRKLIMDVPA